MIEQDKKLVTIIIPTYDNLNQLNSFLGSLLMNEGRHLFDVIVVNNGAKENADYIRICDMGKVIQPDRNLGWEGGLKEGLKHTDAPFVLFANDDVYIPPFSASWLHQLLVWMNNPEVAAVGPSTNVVMGLQNFFLEIPYRALDVTYLIGYFMLLRRSDLEAAGGVDETLGGGDDIDLSIRLRNLGKKLVCLRDLFIYHYGFQTGQKVHGSYYNSNEMTQATNQKLIQKHGFAKWHETMYGYYKIKPAYDYRWSDEDKEGNAIRAELNGIDPKYILELGCGGNKTIPSSVGVDIVANGQVIPELNQFSEADIVCDVSKELPCLGDDIRVIIARHVFEHCLNSIETINIWKKPLRKGGQMYISCPNHELGNTIIMNSQHVHAYSKRSLDDLMTICGFKPVGFLSYNNNVSFTGVYEKI